LRSRVRLWGIAFITALLISAVTPFGSGVSRGAQSSVPALRSRRALSLAEGTSLVILSPPRGLGLPAGQHAGVRYRFSGETPAILELAADGVTLVADQVQPGQEVMHAWTPARSGPHQLRVRALAPDGTLLDSVCVVVLGLPAGSSVQVP